MKMLLFAMLVIMMVATAADATPKVPKPGSYVIVDALDDSTGERMENFTVKVSMEFPEEHSGLSYKYEKAYSRDDKVWISMPPREYSATARITLSSEGYSGSNEETMTSDYYWDNLGKGDNLGEYDFRLKKESGGFCCFPGLSITLSMLCVALIRMLSM